MLIKPLTEDNFVSEEQFILVVVDQKVEELFRVQSLCRCASFLCLAHEQNVEGVVRCPQEFNAVRRSNDLVAVAVQKFIEPIANNSPRVRMKIKFGFFDAKESR